MTEVEQSSRDKKSEVKRLYEVGILKVEHPSFEARLQTMTVQNNNMWSKL
jgi:hypothetical protein